MSLKLYVLIKSDLTLAQQAVQAGHAVAQFGYEHPQEFKRWQQESNILIYLNVDSVHYWNHVLEDGGFKHSMFTEPKLPRHTRGVFVEWYDTVAADTAIAVAPNWTCQYLLFKDLPLAFRKRWWQR